MTGVRSLTAKVREARPARLAESTSERGQTLVEYALILGSIAVVVAAILPMIWPAVEPGFQSAIAALTG